MKKSLLLTTKLALFSLVLVVGSVEASKCKASSKKLRSAECAEEVTKGKSARAVSITTANPDRNHVTGHLYVTGRVFGTDNGVNQAHGTLRLGNSISPVRVDGELTAAQNATVTGNVTVGTKRIVGQANDFDPASNMLLITFTESGDDAAPALINWTYVGTAEVGEDDNVAVVATNGNLPDIVSPNGPARSFVSTDHAYTNTVYMWTGRQANGVNYAATNALNFNRPNIAATYDETDLTLTSSVRTHTYLTKTFGFGLTAANIEDFHGDDETEATSPYAAGTLYYEIVGNNVADVRVGSTYDSAVNLAELLETLTEEQLVDLIELLIDSLVAESDILDAVAELLDEEDWNAFLAQFLSDFAMRGKMNKAQLIAKLLKHKVILQKLLAKRPGLLSKVRQK